jgi:protein-tyrosine phosphatase
VAHGIRTVVDLRNDEEIASMPDVEPRPRDLAYVHVPFDDVADEEFWRFVRGNDLDDSPLYYRTFLDRKPERCAAAYGRSLAPSRVGSPFTASPVATARGL